MHIISSSQKNTLYPLKSNTHHILFSEKHIISSSHKYTLYPLLSIISSFQINTLYPLHRNAHYILFQENTQHLLILYSIQKCTSHINTQYPLFKFKQYILFSDKHNISFSHVYTVYHIRR